MEYSGWFAEYMGEYLGGELHIGKQELLNLRARKLCGKSATTENKSRSSVLKENDKEPVAKLQHIPGQA